MRHAALISLLLVCISSQLFAQQQNTVTVTGFGLTVEEATSNALQAAVRKALGSMIAAKTAIANDELIEDRIVVVSGGFVQEHKIIGTPKLDRGIVELQIEAVVLKNDLTEALQRLQLGPDAIIDRGNFDPDSAAARLAAKKHARQEATKLTPLLLRLRVDLTNVYSGEDALYNDIGEVFYTNVRVSTDTVEWQRYVRDCDVILERISLLNVSQSTLGLALNSDISNQAYTGLMEDNPNQGERALLINSNSVGTSCLSLYRLLNHPIQRQAANSWVLWVQAQSSHKSTLWKGYLLNTDPTVLFPFLTNTVHLHTAITDGNKNVLVEDNPALHSVLNHPNPNKEAEKCDFGIFAVSSEGQILQSSSDFNAMGDDDINTFWKTHQELASPRLNIFLTRNPTVYAPAEKASDVLDLKVITDRVSENFSKAVGNNAVLRLIYTARPNTKTSLISGFRIRRAIPLKNNQYAVADGIASKLEFNYDLQLKKSQLQSELQCQVEITMNVDNQITDIVLESAALQENSLESLLSRNRRILSIDIRNATGVDASIENWRYDHGVKEINLSGSDISVSGLKPLKHLSQLSKLIIKDMDKEAGDEGKIEFLTALADLSQLTELDLSSCDLDGNSIAFLAKLSKLQELTIDNNKDIDNDATKYFLGMKQLKVLSVRKTGIDAKGVAHLEKLLPNCNVHYKE